MNFLPTPWEQFYYSNFKYRPPKTMRYGKVFYKTNQAEWAKQ